MQNFSNQSEGQFSAERILLLRETMRAVGINWLIVPHCDEHQNEYLPQRAERLAWLTGFTGSAGTALIGLENAAVIVDGRYTLQAEDQLNKNLFQIINLSDDTPISWLRKNMKSGDRLGYDSWTTTIKQAQAYAGLADDTGVSINILDSNLIDSIWADQPAIPKTPVIIHGLEFAGKSMLEKLDDLQSSLKVEKADAVLLTDPTSICWLLNIRGQDILRTPLTLCWAIIPATGRGQLFIEKAKLNESVKNYLDEVVDLHAMDDIIAYLSRKASDDKILLFDTDKTSQTFAKAVQDAGSTYKNFTDPIVLPRALKNSTEISGAFSAHRRDGAALCKFLHWLDQQTPNTVDEITCAQKLEQCRIETGKQTGYELMDIAFDTISATGPNAALPHYRVTKDTNRILSYGDLYLVDSGAQYKDGTTDITRTIAIGKVDKLKCDRFTRVLKGHIAVQMARFPAGTNGAALDSFARHSLWQAGLDFAHGTGHGVGSYMSVHEGPQSISPRGSVAIQPGMITSNEPAYYKQKEFGIRIENLELAKPASFIQGGDIAMMEFETLTLCPIDKRLIATDLLTEHELNWLNKYHARVERELSPFLSGECLNWLQDVTKPVRH